MRKFIAAAGIALFSMTTLKAQTVLTKDAMNSFARYTANGNFKDLETAKKQADDAYKTRSDSSAVRNNLVRALVYSTLAYADSTLKLSYKRDPVAETLRSLEILDEPKTARNIKSELNYIHDRLHKAYLVRANRSFKQRQYREALDYYHKLDSAGYKDPAIVHNMALLFQETGDYMSAAECYKRLISEKPRPEYFLVLANLYESADQGRNSVDVLKKGVELYPDNRDLMFKLLNVLSDRNDFVEIAAYSEKALKLDEYNINLNYLAGFSYDLTGQPEKAEKYYKEVLSINPNNYEGNYSLGLLYLDQYIKNRTKNNLLYVAKYYLTKANEIDPQEPKSLNSLSMLYKFTGEGEDLKRVTEKINQLNLN